MRVKVFVKMSEEVLGFEIESGKLKLFIRGCE